VSEGDNPVGTFTVDVPIADHFHPERTRTVPRALDGLGLMVGPRGKRRIDRGPKLAMAALLVS
jgi:hypothetical protein